MKSKRGSNKIYYYIDLFFILLPLISFIGIFIGFCILQKNTNVNDYNWHDFLEQLYNNQEYYFSSFFENFFGIGNIDWEQSTNFFVKLNDIIYSLFKFLGVGPADNVYDFIYFIQNYFAYLIMYEIISLFINIIMWLPRWARNKVRDWSGSDSV